MTISPTNARAALLALAGSAVFLAPATAVAAGHGAASSGCHGQAKHHFIEATSARQHGKKTKVVGHPATFHCGGEDDGHYSVAKSSETLTLTPSTVVTVFKVPENPSTTEHIKASALPKWLKKNASEAIYEIHGSKSHVTKLTEQFHP